MKVNGITLLVMYVLNLFNVPIDKVMEKTFLI